MVTVAALIVCAASLNLKRTIVSAGAPLASRPTQSLNDYYSSKEAVSQESETERNTAAPVRTGQARSEASSRSGEQPDFYLVTVYEGKIGVFENGDKNRAPFLTADVNVYLLPQEDLALLRQGIIAENFAAVKRVLEDYQ